MSHISIRNIILSQFIVSLVNVFFRAIQQLNVMEANYLLMAPTSYMQGLCFILATILTVDIGLRFNHQFANFLAMGTGGAVGVIAATWIYGGL
jgi:uncharacterized protein YebE (UPF0316 family)